MYIDRWCRNETNYISCLYLLGKNVSRNSLSEPKSYWYLIYIL